MDCKLDLPWKFKYQFVTTYLARPYTISYSSSAALCCCCCCCAIPNSIAMNCNQEEKQKGAKGSLDLTNIDCIGRELFNGKAAERESQLLLRNHVIRVRDSG